jgi:hypothetical protein
MKRKISVFLMAGLVISLCALTTLAQAQEQKAQLYAIWDIVVHPSKVGDFEAGAKEEVALYAKYKFPYAWSVTRTFDNHYYYLFPVENFAAIDNIFKAFDKVAKMAGEEYQEMLDLFTGTYEYVQPSVYSLNYELSFFSEKQKEKAEEENFVFFDIFYFKTGKEREVEKLMKEMIALVEEKGTTEAQSWYCYQGIMGAETPVHYMVARAKNAIDFYTQNAKMWKLLGEEGDSLYPKLMNLLRKREHKQGWFRPDLSYTPKEK